MAVLSAAVLQGLVFGVVRAAVDGQPFVISSECWVSERSACRVAGQHRATQRHEPSAATTESRRRIAGLAGWIRQRVSVRSRSRATRGLSAPRVSAGVSRSPRRGRVVNHKEGSAALA